MVKGVDWHEERTRSPSAIPDDGIRDFLEEKAAHLFATQLHTRLRSLEQTRESPKFLRRNSYNLYLDGHFALLDPRDLERTTLSPTPPSSSDRTSLEHTPEPDPRANHYQVYPIKNVFPQSRTLQRRINRKLARPQNKRNHKISNKQIHPMLRRSKNKQDTPFYELDWIGRNTVTVCQLAEKGLEFASKKG